jgi:hypothetical protein
MQQATYAAKNLGGLLAGWVLGHGLMWGAFALGALLDAAAGEMSDLALLGGMLLAIGLVAVLLISAGLAEMRRVPAWLTSFLLGLATAPVLTVFAYTLFVWSNTWCD